MTEEERAAYLMLRMGFPVTEIGPYVTELRAHILDQVRRGMTNRSGGTWRDDDIWSRHEDRARELLGVDWAFEHGHTYRVEAIDGFRWRYLRAWLGDRVRYLAFRWRMFRDRNLTNPYRGKGAR